MKNAITQLFNNWYDILKAFNDSNRQLLGEIITAPSPIKLNTSSGDVYLEVSGNIDSDTLNTKYAPKLLALFNNTINIARVREYADKFLRDGLFMYLLYYNLVNKAQYNIPANKYYKAKISQPNTPSFIDFVYCYLEGLTRNTDIDKTTEIAKLITSPYKSNFFDTYENDKKSIEKFINAANKPDNYAEQRSCLNPDFYKIVSKFIGHLLTHYTSTTPAHIDIKYDHTNLIGADNNIFYGSDIFALATRILSLEGKSFSTRKESLVIELYKTVNLSTQLQAFTSKYKAIFNNNPSISNTIVLRGGNPIKPVRKTRKYKSTSTRTINQNKLTMIIKKYNEKTKTNLFQARAQCNCNGTKRRGTKKFCNL